MLFRTLIPLCSSFPNGRFSMLLHTSRIVGLSMAFLILQLSPLSAQEAKLRETLKGHKGPINCVVFSPDGKILATGGANTVKLWDLKTGKTLATFEGHTAGIHAVAFSPTGKMLACGSLDKSGT